MTFNESDTRANLIDPKLQESGWSNDLITREYPISAGRIEPFGESFRRAPPKKADYVLRLCQNGQALAVVEAKEESLPASAGMPQAKEYAKKLGVIFAYASNGHEIEEFDFTTNKQTTITRFPSPDELRSRYLKAKIKIPTEKILGVLQYSYPATPTISQLRAYQEAAVQNALEAIFNNKKRLLLTLATGTGKTVIAFNLVWRLVKSGYFRRVLFIADRNFLRTQAFNVFAPFGEARATIPTEKGALPKHNDVYFSTYQALYAPSKDKRVYEEYPSDFFDLVIIDECHRSGFGTWHDILTHFSGAVHLGMTATPKRTDNIDTYRYFGEPVYVYSFGSGVEDGYLAPFVVHRILTNIDKEGKLEIAEAKSKGAEILYPAEIELKDIYEQSEFEHTITIPERTHQIAEHLAKLLKSLDPIAKTMVFCVDSDHADLMAKELQNLFADFGFDNFAVSIIARNGDILEAEYERFRDSEKKTPVIATTVDLLTTGVDVPSVRNIVIVKPIGSKIVFKQIIGRGSRLDPVTGKHFFRIIDYIGATRLFDDWERPPEPPEGEGEEGPTDFFISGMVVDAETQEPIPLARVILQRAPNLQPHTLTGRDGRFTFSDLPKKKFPITVSAAEYKPRTVSLEAKDTPKEFAVIELSKKVVGPQRKVMVKGLPVFIAEEERLVLEKEGKMLRTEEYVEYAEKEVVKRASSAKDLRDIWVNPTKRNNFLAELAEHSIYPEILAEILKRPDLDGYDILAQVCFDAIPLSRDERVEALRNKEQKFLSAFNDNARDIIYALLEKYRLAGVEEIENPKVFELPPFYQMGGITGVERRFGNLEKVREAIGAIREKLYPE